MLDVGAWLLACLDACFVVAADVAARQLCCLCACLPPCVDSGWLVCPVTKLTATTIQTVCNNDDNDTHFIA